MQEELLASLGTLSCKCWSLAAHVGHASQSFQPFSSNSEHWVDRPKGPLLWFHALTLGETAVVLPVVFRCLLEYNEHVHVLLTTKSAEAISLLSSSLPSRVLVQDVPLDSYISMGRFLQHFQPQACILMESPAWPVLVESCAARSIKLGLLNARMSSRAFLAWFQPRVSRALLRRMLGSFSLIVPQSDIDVGRFRIFGATLTQMPGWCSDLKYAAALGNSVWHLWRPKPSRIASLHGALCGRPMWVAAHTQPGEEEAVATAHTQLAKDWPSLLTVLAPAVSSRCSEVAEMLQTAHALKVLLWSSVVDMITPQGHKQQQQQQPQQANRGISRLLGWAGRGGSNSNLNAASQHSQQQQQQHGATGSSGAEVGRSSSSSGPSAVDPALLLKGVDVLLLDLQADLPLMYSVSEVAFIGSSLLEGCSGHNLAEAAVAGCAVLVGEHAGHFNTMADELNQAAIVAAEEASAAVNSSGPMEDPFFAANDTAAPAGSTAAAPGAGAAAAAAAAGSSSGAGAGPASVAELATAEGQESEEPSPRDGSHWRGVLNYAQHEDDIHHHHQQQQHAFADGSGSSSRDGHSSSSHQQQLQQQQHQQLHELLQQQSSLRPSTAPTAVSSLGGASYSSRQPPDSSSSSRAGAPDGSSGGGGNGPGAPRNAAALLYRRQARTGSSNNSSCVSSPVASQRPSTAGGAATSQQQQQQGQEQQQQQQDGTGYLQQYYSQQQRLSEQQHQQPQQQRTRGQSPLQPLGGRGEQQVQQPQQQDPLQGRHQQQQGCCPEPCHAVEQQCHAAVERPLPQAPPPSAATNTPVNGPTGNVTPVTPAGSFGGADPALLQQPDSRDLAHRLAQQQRQQAAGVGQQPRGSDCSTEHQQQQQQQPQQQGMKQQQQHVHGGSSGGGSCSQHQQQQQLQLQHLGNSSGGGCASNCASTPLSEVADLYSMPFPASPHALVLPHTPHPTPEDSAQTMGGRSPMLSCAGAGYSQDLASLALQAPVLPLLQQAPSAEPSWQSAASSSGSTGGGCWPGQCSSSSTGHDAAGAASVTSTVASSRDALQEGSSCDPQQQQQQHRRHHNHHHHQQQQHEYQQGHQQEQQELVDDCEHAVDPAALQRPACPSPPDPACFSRASAASAVGSMPVFENSNGSNGSSGSRSRSRLSRAISSGGWQEEQQRQRHRQHLQGIVGRVWRGGSEGGSPMVAALAEAAAAAAAGGCSSSSSSDDDEEFDGRAAAPRMLRGSRSPRAAVARDASPWASDSNGTPHTGVLAAADGVDVGTKAVSLNGGLSAESSGVYEDAVDGQECDHGVECESDQECEVGPDGPMPFSRSPTFAELAACNRGSSADGNCNSSSPGKAPQLNGSSTASAGVGGGGMPAREGAQATASNGCSRTGSQEVFVPDLCPADIQLQQQGLNSRPLSDQGSVGWEDWDQQHEPSCNGTAGSHHEAAAAAAAAAAMAAAPASTPAGRGAEDSSNGQPASSGVSAASGSSTAAAGVPNRTSDGGANAGASRLGDPRLSRHYLDLPSESSSVAGEDEIQPEQLQLQPHQLQALQQPNLLSYSGVGPNAAAGGGSSSGGGGGVWFEQHSGVATPPSWGATPRSTPQQQHSATTTPSAGVTPRGRSHGHRGISGGSSNSNGYPPQQHNSYNHHAQNQPHHHGHYSGRRSVDLQHPHPHLQQQHLTDGSSGGGSGMFSPLSRLPGGHSNDSSYRRAESVTSMTSFATSVGGDRDLHDDQPGSSRMSLIGENSSHLGYSTAGGRLSGFTGGVTGAFASTGRFSECATPRSTVTEVFRGQQALQVAVVGGDGGGLLAPGTSYLRYRGDYILPATHLPAAPQGPAVWRVSGVGGLSMALNTLLQEPLERRSRGHAAAQAAAKLASGLVSTVWHVVDDMVVTPALQEFVAQGGLAGEAAAQHAARAPRIPGHPRI